MSARQALLAQYVETHPEEIARQVDLLPTQSLTEAIAAMGVDAAAALLPYLAPTHAARGLAALEVHEAADLLGRQDPDIAASLLRLMSPSDSEARLEAMALDRAAPVRALLAYPPQSAGGVMDPLVLTAPVASDVADVRALIQRHAAHLYYYIYIVDEKHRLAGVLDIAELFQADPDTPLRTVMRTSPAWLAADATFDAVFAHAGWHHYDALPVLDADRHVLGVLRHRRMRQLLATHRPPAADEHGVQTVMALGEIYWLGLCGLLQGLAATATEPIARKEA